VTSPIQLSDVYRDRYYENQGLPELVTLIAPTERRVLDIGCGAGGNLRLLSARGYDPVGVTLSLSEARACREQGFDCHVADLSVGLPFGAGAFDAVILSHVLEHMPWPEAALAAALANVRSGGGVYVAVPNALFLPERLRFLRGQFRYTETGIMDRTHLRFFDFASVRRLLEVVGVTVTGSCRSVRCGDLHPRWLPGLTVGECVTGPRFSHFTLSLQVGCREDRPRVTTRHRTTTAA